MNLIRTEVIPDSCCAPDSTNTRIPGSSLSFYRIPSGDSENEKEHRLKWLNAIHRDKWSEEEIRNARLLQCSFYIGYETSSQIHSCKLMHKKQQLAKVFLKLGFTIWKSHLFFFSRKTFFESAGPWLCTDNFSAD